MESGLGVTRESWSGPEQHACGGSSLTTCYHTLVDCHTKLLQSKFWTLVKSFRAIRVMSRTKRSRQFSPHPKLPVPSLIGTESTGGRAGWGRPAS